MNLRRCKGSSTLLGCSFLTDGLCWRKPSIWRRQSPQHTERWGACVRAPPPSKYRRGVERDASHTTRGSLRIRLTLSQGSSLREVSYFCSMTLLPLHSLSPPPSSRLPLSPYFGSSPFLPPPTARIFSLPRRLGSTAACRRPAAKVFGQTQ